MDSRVRYTSFALIRERFGGGGAVGHGLIVVVQLFLKKSIEVEGGVFVASCHPPVQPPPPPQTPHAPPLATVTRGRREERECFSFAKLLRVDACSKCSFVCDLK